MQLIPALYVKGRPTPTGDLDLIDVKNENLKHLRNNVRLYDW